MTEYNIRLNPNCAAAVHTGLKFKAGDKGITFKIAVDELDTTGTTAKIVFQRANGTSVESDISGTNGVYTYKTLGNEFAVPGKTVADVKFYAADARVSTASFVFEVSGDTMDGLGAGAGGYSDRLEQLATEAEDAMKNAENVSKALENLLIVYQNKFGEVGVLNPKGTYNNATTYEAFDLVYDGGVSWLCLQRCTGVTPAEGAYWQLFASADGGNAAKLGGKSASEYFLKSGGDIDGTLHARGATDTPIYNHSNSSTDESYIGYTVGDTLRGYIGFKNGKAHIHNVGDIATTADLANYLPKSGGEIITNGISTYLPQVTLTLKNGVNDGGAMVRFDDAKGFLGFLGFENVHTPIFSDGNGNPYPLLHTGNKPSGTYTGNGSTTARNINIGGIGSFLLIIESQYITLVGYSGAVSFQFTTGNMKCFTGGEINFKNGVLYMAIPESASNFVNYNGAIYYYQVL